MPDPGASLKLGEIIAMHSFAVAAPGKDVTARFAFDVSDAVAVAKQRLARAQGVK